MLSHLEINPVFAENFEAQDAELKLEGEKEEMIASLHLIELNHYQFLYQTQKFQDHTISDYVVYLPIEDKPPRLFS